MPRQEHRISRYVVREHTAQRLVAEAQGVPLVALGILWGSLLPVAALIRPWQGGTRLFIVVTTAVVVAAVGLLVAYFVPQQERLTVDLEAGDCRAERAYLFPRKAWRVQVPLEAAEGVRCRRRFWRDGPGAKASRWVVELVGEEGQVWRLAEGEEKEPMQELARLVAEVAGCSLAEASQG